MAATAKPLAKRGSSTTDKKPAPLSRKNKPNAETKLAPKYLQAKLAVSHPADSAEQEADRVATQVARAPRIDAPQQTSETMLQTASLEPGITPEKNEVLAPKPLPAAKQIQRIPEQQRQVEDEGEETLQTKRGDGGETQEQVDEATEQRITALRGSGAPLTDATLIDMNARFGRDFSAVRVHTDTEAAELCVRAHARAFTVGDDVFFSPGEYAPGTDKGRELLAHELTHVVQQTGSGKIAISRSGTNTNTVTPPSPTARNDQGDVVNNGNKTITFTTLPIPGFKGEAHRGELYRNWSLRRNKRYSSRTRPSNQQSVWKNNVNTTTLQTQLRAKAEAANSEPSNGSYIFRGPARPITAGGRHQPRGDNHYYFGNLEEIAKAISAPSWNRRGSRSASMEVDHIVEMQISGAPGVAQANQIGNMELLERRPNQQSGGFIDKAVNSRVDRALSRGSATLTLLEHAIPNLATTRGVDDRRGLVRTTFDLVFESFTTNETPRRARHPSINENSYWSRTAIEAGEHLGPVRPANFSDLGQQGRILIFPSRSGGIGKSFFWNGNNTNPRRGNDEHEWLKPFVITAKRFFVDETQPSLWLGEFDIEIPESDSKYKPMRGTVYVERLSGTSLAGVIQKASVKSKAERLEKKGLSPITVANLEISANNGLMMQGDIIPDVPLINRAQLQYRVDGDELSIFKVFQGEDFDLPRPFTMTESALTLAYSSREGFSISGRAGLEIDRVGSGFLEGGASTEGGFAVRGGFDFDSELFDQAHIELWYRHNEFGASGDIGITNPDKIRGIRSANLHVEYGDNTINATGSVEPNIPGIQQASLSVTHSEEEGLIIGGNLQLTANPAIHSGSIDVTVRKRDNSWRVAATGSAQPAIPGLNSELTVRYDDGAFGAEFGGQFQRGMLTGQVTVGATNRTLDEGGQPTGEPSPDSPIIVYGSGSSTIRLAPWLEGTAGMTFAPNGEVTLRGEIGLPDQLEIFRRLEINKRLLDVSTQIPIVPGVVAEVGGNLTATAGIGPGALDQLRIGIEYNPAREQDTHVTGDAHLNIPADAGLRLGARAGIGLGITGASATGGLEIGGAMGIQGAAEAGVHIDWMPSRGLQIDAEGYLHAEPRFRFDVGGYVSVRALGFSVYDNSWELAAYELGSNMRLGVRFPINYREGQPFNISLNDVQFEVPEVNPGAMIRELGGRVI